MELFLVCFFLRYLHCTKPCVCSLICLKVFSLLSISGTALGTPQVSVIFFTEMDIFHRDAFKRNAVIITEEIYC